MTPEAPNNPIPSPRGETVLAFAVIALAGVFFGLPSLPEPFGVDQGIYAYIAERVLEGAVDHRDVFDHKPPGIHFVYAATFALFGHSMWSVRLLDLIAAILTGWGMYALGRQWTGRRLGLICGLLYVAFYEAYFDWMSRAQPETWIALVFVFGLLLIEQARKWPGMFAAGILLGIGLWFKPTILLLALLWLAVLIDRATREPNGGWKQFGWNLFLIGLGATAISTVILVYYAANGALRDLYEAVVVFNARYHTRLELVRTWRDAAEAIGFIALPLYALSALVPLAALAAVGLPKSRRPVLLGFGWLVLGFGTVFWQGSTAKSHYVLALAPMVALACLALDSVIEAVAKLADELRDLRKILLAVALMIAVTILVNVAGLFADRWTKFAALATGKVSRQQYYASFRFNGYSFEDLRQLGAYLETQTSPAQTVFVWGYRPIVAYLAHRPMPTRFIFRYPLTRTENPLWWKEFLSDLEQSPPAFFLVMVRDGGRRHRYHPEPSNQALAKHERLSRFLSERYEFDRQITDFEIYRLRSNERPTSDTLPARKPPAMP